MFWTRFYELCLKKGSRPNPVGREIGVSSGVITNWKNGAIPSGEMLVRIADYFDVSIDYLLGRSDSPKIECPAEKAPSAVPPSSNVVYIRGSDGFSKAVSLSDQDWETVLRILNALEQENHS